MSGFIANSAITFGSFWVFCGTSEQICNVGLVYLYLGSNRRLEVEQFLGPYRADSKDPCDVRLEGCLLSCARSSALSGKPLTMCNPLAGFRSEVNQSFCQQILFLSLTLRPFEHRWVNNELICDVVGPPIAHKLTNTQNTAGPVVAIILEILKYGRNDTWLGISSEILFVSFVTQGKES